jgi:hypothetical protein
LNSSSKFWDRVEALSKCAAKIRKYLPKWFSLHIVKCDDVCIIVVEIILIDLEKIFVIAKDIIDFA